MSEATSVQSESRKISRHISGALENKLMSLPLGTRRVFLGNLTVALSAPTSSCYNLYFAGTACSRLI